MEGSLNKWTIDAVGIVQRTLEASASGMASASSTGTSSTTSVNRNSRGEKCSGGDGVELPERPTPAWRPTVLQRVFSLGRRESERDEQGARDTIVWPDDRVEGAEGEAGGATGTPAADEVAGNGDELERGEGGVAASGLGPGAHFSTSGDVMGSTLLAPLQPGAEPSRAARVDLAEFLSDTEGEGAGVGIEWGNKGETEIMGTLLETSKQVVSAIEAQQKARPVVYFVRSSFV